MPRPRRSGPSPWSSPAAERHLSGDHLNPAVTLGFSLTRHFPARSIGPALVSGELHDLWIYLVGPILGAALGALA